jgi:hypothetical protein
LILEDHQQKADSLRGNTGTIHTESYRSHAITSSFAKENTNLEFIDKIIEFKINQEK